MKKSYLSGCECSRLEKNDEMGKGVVGGRENGDTSLACSASVKKWNTAKF